MAGHAACRRIAAVLLAGVGLLAASCTGPGPATPRADGSSHPAASGSGPAALTGPERRALAARYLAIAAPANRQLEIDFDEGLNGHDRRHLQAADADLRNAAATERTFDRQLLGIPFPPPIDDAARALYRLNQLRASLTTQAAASASLRQLHRYERWLNTANIPVEQQVRQIRRQLGLPPAATS